MAGLGPLSDALAYYRRVARHIPIDPRDKSVATPPVNVIKLAVQMMKAPGAPQFSTKRETREATLDLARQLWKSETA